MHYICEISNGTKKIISELASVDDFLPRIKCYLTDTCQTFTLLESVGIDDIKNDEKYTENTYLLQNTNTIDLVQKTKIVSEGYIYNTVNYNVTITHSWEIIPFENLFKKKLNTIQISELRMDQIKKNSSFLINAKRGSGKSWLIGNLLNKLETISDDKAFIKNTLIISPTDRMNTFYYNYFPNAKIIYSYDKKIVLDHLNKGKGCVVLDDCLSQENCRDLGYDIRKYNVPFIISQLCPNWTETDFADVDYYVFFQENYLSNKEKIWFINRDIVPNYNDFELVFDTVTQDHRAMFINRMNMLDNLPIKERIFWYKAEQMKKVEPNEEAKRQRVKYIEAMRIKLIKEMR